jgi:hypothetical protein
MTISAAKLERMLAVAVACEHDDSKLSRERAQDCFLLLADRESLASNLKDATRLLEDALNHGRALHPTGCDCRSGHTCFSCEVRERIKFGKAALENK